MIAPPTGDTTMTDSQRLWLRIRQRSVRLYEITLFMMLGALSLGVGISIASPEAEAEPAHCGNIQSSTVVINR
jgi:hypothetical protein